MGTRRAAVAALASVLLATGARADDRATPPPRRYEFVPLPDVGGNDEVGVELGVIPSLARFREDARPYLWRLDGVLSISLKDDARGFRAIQHYDVVHFDATRIFSTPARLDTRAVFVRDVEALYFGEGNAAAAPPRPAPPDAASAYQYRMEEAVVRSTLRVPTGTPFDVAATGAVRYDAPDAYATSKLEDDLRAGAVTGGRPALLASAGGGFVVDTRDNEFVPRHGVYDQVGVAATVGSAERVRYGEASAVLSTYQAIVPSVVFASRVVASLEVGRVPFYDLQRGGVFDPAFLVGGDRGVRGVPSGRFAGPVKLVANTELRTLAFPPFRVLAWRVRMGTTTFFDWGRVFGDYRYDPVRDGRTLGVKLGVGGGLFFQWEEASVFRIETAYSPDRDRVGLPVAIYLGSGFAF